MLYRTKHVWLFTVYTVYVLLVRLKSSTLQNFHNENPEFERQIWIFFLYKNLFFFVRLNEPVGS